MTKSNIIASVSTILKLNKSSEEQSGRTLRAMMSFRRGLLAMSVAISSSACAQHPKQTASKESAPPVKTEAPQGSQPTPSLRAVFPTDKVQQSGTLFEALRQSKLPVRRSSGQEILRAYDVQCRVKGETGVRTCVVYNQPRDVKGSKSYLVPRSSTESLSNLLFGLPVAQGDSGAETRFVECQKPQTGSLETAHCVVAIELDYQGP